VEQVSLSDISNYETFEDVPDDVLIGLFNLRDENEEMEQEVAEQLAGLYQSLLKNVKEEDLSEAFFLLINCLKRFKIEEAPEGINGFRPYFFFRLKMHFRGEATKEIAKSVSGTPVSHYKKHRRFEREDARHFAETGEHLNEHEFFDDNYKGFKFVDRFERQIGDEDSGTVGDLVGKEDDNWQSDEFYALFDDDEKWLIEEVALNGTGIKEICLELYGNDSDHERNSVKKVLADITDKIIGYYGDEREEDCAFGSLFRKCVEEAESQFAPSPFLATRVQQKVAGVGSRKRDFLTRKPCDKCGAEFRPIHNSHRFCSEKCCRAGTGGIPKDLTKEWLLEELRTKTFGQVAFEMDKWTYRVKEWAWYYGIRRREQLVENKVGLEKHPTELPGCPARSTVAHYIRKTSLQDMRERWGIKHDKGLLKLISWYGLEDIYQKRDKSIYCKDARKDVKIRTSRMAKGNKRVIASRLAKGWDPLIPEDPTKEQMMEVLLTHTWAEMADHFQISEKNLMKLAKKYKIKHLRPRLIFSKEGAKKSAKGLADSLRRGRKIPTKEELKKDLKTLTWTEISDKWEWSKPWLVQKAKEYDIYDMKTRKDAASERQADLKWPFPSKEEYAEMLRTERLYKLSPKLHRTEEVLRRKAVKMGLRHLLIEHHAPSKQALNKKLKRSGLRKTAKFYGFSEKGIHNLIDTYQIDMEECAKAYRQHKGEQTARRRKQPKSKRQQFIDSLPSKKEVEKMLETPNLSATKLAEMMDCDLRTARHHVEERLGLVWPTNRSIVREEIDRGERIFENPHDVIPREQFVPEVKKRGMFWARRFFELTREQMNALMHIHGITPDGRSVGLYAIRNLSDKQLVRVIRGRGFAEIENRYGVPKDMMRAEFKRRGMPARMLPGVPFNEEVAVTLMSSMTRNEMEEYFDVKTAVLDRWLKEQKDEHGRAPLRRSIIDPSAAVGRKVKADNIQAFIESLDQDQFEADLKTMNKLDIREKYKTSLTVLRAAADSLGLEWKVRRITGNADIKQKLIETWNSKYDLPTKEELKAVLEERMSLEDTAKKLGIPHGTLRRLIRQWNLGDTRKTKRSLVPPKEELEEMLNRGMSYSAIGREAGVTMQYISQAVKKHGIEHLLQSTRVNPDPTKEQLTECVDKKMSVSKIMVKFNIARDRTNSLLKEYGLYEKAYPPDPTKEQMESLVNMGYSGSKIMKKLDIGRDKYKTLVRKYGLG
jgi:hypothetical protein